MRPTTIAASPLHVRTWQRFLAELGRFAEAEAAAREAERIFSERRPDRPYVNFPLANALRMQRNPTEARAVVGPLESALRESGGGSVRSHETPLVWNIYRGT